MKKVTLKRIILYNFRGVSCDVMPNIQGITKISARNKVGKSSIQSAWNWLLTGYTDSVYPKNHELFDSSKPISPDTETTKVVAHVEIDGIEYVLERHAEPKFIKKNGTYEKANTDTYEYLIDGISVGATEYNMWVSSFICDIDMLPYCLDGAFFSTLAEGDKNKARKVLETLIGSVNDDDFNKKYEDLIPYFEKGYSVEQVKKKFKDSISEYEKSINDLQSQFEAKKSIIDEYNLINYEAIKSMIEEKEREIEHIDSVILGKSESIKPIIKKRDEIFMRVNEEMTRLKNAEIEYNNAFMTQKSEIDARINGIVIKNKNIDKINHEIEMKFDAKRRQLADCESRLEYLCSERNELLKKRDEIKERIFDKDEQKCPLCGQELPYELIEEKSAQFNDKKESELESVIKRGKAIRSSIDELTSMIESLKSEISNGFTKEEAESCDELKKQLMELCDSFTPYKETDEYKREYARIIEIKGSMPVLHENDSAALVEAKRAVMDTLGALNRQYGHKDKILELEKDIELLKLQIRDASCEMVSLEGKLNKLSEFLEERANSISMRVNGMMKDTMILMYRKQKDGSMVSDCVVCDKDGVKFSTVNTSNRILIRMELQKLFCEKLDVQLPIFVDEYKLFDDYNAPKPKSDEQMIVMFPSNSPVLVIE